MSLFWPVGIFLVAFDTQVIRKIVHLRGQNTAQIQNDLGAYFQG